MGVFGCFAAAQSATRLSLAALPHTVYQKPPRVQAILARSRQVVLNRHRLAGKDRSTDNERFTRPQHCSTRHGVVIICAGQGLVGFAKEMQRHNSFCLLAVCLSSRNFCSLPSLSPAYTVLATTYRELACLILSYGACMLVTYGVSRVRVCLHASQNFQEPIWT